MSRVGKKPLEVPVNVKIDIQDKIVSVEGPKGKLEHRIAGGLKAVLKDKKLFIERPVDTKKERSLHGLTRTVIKNLITGVTEGYKKELEIRGVGFKAQAQGANVLEITLGFSHPIKHEMPEGITVKTPKPTQIVIEGPDKVKVGEVAAELRDYFKPEPYTGKGIRYLGEYVRHKAGKTVVK